MGASRRLLLGRAPPPRRAARRAQTRGPHSPCQAPGKAPLVFEGVKSRNPPMPPRWWEPPETWGAVPALLVRGPPRQLTTRVGSAARFLILVVGLPNGFEPWCKLAPLAPLPGPRAGFPACRARPGVRCPRTRPWGRAASWTAPAALSRLVAGFRPCVSVPGGSAPTPGRMGPPSLTPLLSILSPALAPDGRRRCREAAAVPTNPRGCLVANAERCVQEELSSTSVEHLIINPNAAYEKFRDKRLGTKGVGEPGRSGRGGLWGAWVTELTPGRAQPP